MRPKSKHRELRCKRCGVDFRRFAFSFAAFGSCDLVANRNVGILTSVLMYCLRMFCCFLFILPLSPDVGVS